MEYNLCGQWPFSKCANRMIRLFLCLADVFPHDFGSKLKEVCIRLTNTFYKGFVSKSMRMRAVVPDPTTSRKLRKLE